MDVRAKRKECEQEEAKTAKRAVGYCRVSSEEQAKEGMSMETQEQKIRDYARTYDLEIVDIISDEAISGSRFNRPGLNRVVEMAERKVVDAVIVYRLCRLSRKVYDTLHLIEKVFAKNGVEFISVVDRIDTTTAIGKAMLNFQSTFNQWFRDYISEQTEANLSLVKGKQRKTGGTVPYGYEAVEQDGKYRLMELPEEQNVVADIVVWKEEGHSLRRICRKLEALGIPTKTGKRRWSAQAVKDILEYTPPNCQG